jgi:mxaK protein
MAIMKRLTSVDLALACVLLGLLGSAAYEGFQLWRASSYNRQLKEPATIAVGPSTPPQLIFAAAQFKDQQGHYQEALRLYNAIENAGDDELRKRVLFNIATIYLREAAKTWNAVGVLEHARVATLVELAKQKYRAVLRLDPGHWDARYNLEYAFRITPPPKEHAKGDFQGNKSSVFATLPALPGGGP